MRFGEQLRSWRKARGMTQRELSDAIGLHFTYISKIEQDQVGVPSLATLDAIARHLAVPRRDVFRAARRLPVDLSKPELEARIIDLEDLNDRLRQILINDGYDIVKLEKMTIWP